MSDAVETLLHVQEGDEVALQAAYYDFASDYAVRSIEEVTFACPTGGVWRAREIDVESTNTRGRSSSYSLTVAYGADAPRVASYGRLIDVERDPEAVDNDAAHETDEETHSCPECGEEFETEGSARHHYYYKHTSGSTGVPDGDYSWRELHQKSRGDGDD